MNTNPNFPIFEGLGGCKLGCEKSGVSHAMREPQSERKRSRLKPNQEWRNHDDGFQYRFTMPAVDEDEPTRRKREHRDRAALTSARAAVGLGVGSGRSAQNRNQLHAEREK